MAGKRKNTGRMVPMQRCTVREIVDPSEQAALDERIRRYEEAMAAAAGPERKSPKRAASKKNSSEPPA